MKHLVFDETLITTDQNTNWSGYKYFVFCYTTGKHVCVRVLSKAKTHFSRHREKNHNYVFAASQKSVVYKDTHKNTLNVCNFLCICSDFCIDCGSTDTSKNGWDAW